MKSGIPYTEYHFYFFTNNERLVVFYARKIITCYNHLMNEKEPTVKIYSCFPEQEEFSDEDNFLEKLIDLSKEETNEGEDELWGGFLGEEYLKDALQNKINKDDHKKYDQPGKKIVRKIRKTIEDTSNKCQTELPNPNDLLRIFIYPWFPSEDMQEFEGTMGTTFWAGTFHIYIDVSNFSLTALEETVAHEYNHCIRLNYFSPFEQTILEAMIMEGFAEHFREDVIGGERAPWTQALNPDEIKQALKKLDDSLHVKTENRELYEDIFFGGDNYKRWTGYSAGYLIVDSYLQENQEVSWKELIKKDPLEILKKSKFK